MESFLVWGPLNRVADSGWLPHSIMNREVERARVLDLGYITFKNVNGYFRVKVPLSPNHMLLLNIGSVGTARPLVIITVSSRQFV